MFKDLIKFYKIGKKLGLSSREMNKILIFDNSNHPMLNTILFIVGIIVTILFGVLIVILGIYISRSTYPTGAEYSTIKVKDFKKYKSASKLFRI